MRIGLRIDVDTFRGTAQGVPNLARLLAEHDLHGTFFFCVGPDNMGRHLWRLLRPDFLWKMLRTRAASLYGWDILLRGAFWPGPVIGRKLAGVIQSAAQQGHEVGLHAWDHHAWQAHIDSMGADAVRRSLERGVEALSAILGRPVTCSAVPGWKSNDLVLAEKSRFPFAYNSDCRGDSIFYPVVDGQALAQPQIPVTLPTYDELKGRDGVTDDNYNERLWSLVRPDRLNVLTVHAEVEGLVCLAMFDRFILLAQARGATFVPLGELLGPGDTIGRGRLTAGDLAGRSGWVACQAPA